MASPPRSLQHIGLYPIGTLRPHSPSNEYDKVAQPSHQCLKNGDVFILRSVKSGSVLGYNVTNISVPSGGGFDGIKCIPPGLHFFWGGLQPETKDADQFFKLRRNGFWVVVERLGVDDYGHAHVYNWGSSVLEEQVSHAETWIQRKDLPEFFDSLTQFETHDLNIIRYPSARGLAATDTSLWNHLTCCIKNNLLTKITRHDWNKWNVSTNHDYARESDNPGKGKDWDSNINMCNEVLHFMFPKEDPTSSSQIPGPNHKGDLIDTSFNVLTIINECCTYQDADEIIGELQFCFIVGMKLEGVRLDDV